MSGRGRRPSRGLLVAALLALAACGGSTAPSSAAPTAPLPELIRLWRPPQALPLSVVPATRPVVATRTLWRTSFDGQDDRTWYAVVGAPPQTPGGDSGLRYKPLELSFGPVPLQRKAGLAAVVSVPVLGGQAVSVRITARLSGVQPGAPEQAVALVLEQREPFDPTAWLSAQDAADLLSSRRHASHVLEMAASETARTLHTDFVTDRATRELQINLVAPEDGQSATVVESVELVALPIEAQLAQGGSFPELQRLGDPALPSVRVSLDRDEREGLLARPGERIEFGLPACATAQRLELSTGVAPRDGGLPGAVRLTATLQAAGGAAQTLLDRRRSAPASEEDAAWQDEDLQLPPLPQGGTLSFACEAEGDDPPLAVWGHPTLCRPRAKAPPNVVLISLDTLRPDRLGCYGGKPGLSPHLDALAAQGLRFAHAYSTSSYTLPSHASLLTGQWPALHGAVGITDRLDPERSAYLAQLLADAGYVTAAFTGGGYVSPDYGFARGFDRYATNDPVWALDSVRGQLKLKSMSWERAPQATALLRRYATPMIEDWIARRAGGAPFFLFLHTYIVHNYAPDVAALGRHGLLGPNGEEQAFNHQDYDAFNEGKLGGEPARDKIRADYLPYYDATVDMADAFVGRVLDAIERAGVKDDTLVLVVADHGEEFGEHDFFGHGQTLYEEAVHIPLIARLPAGADGPPPGSVSDPLVSLADVAPWILRLCGLQPDPRMHVEAPLGPDQLSPPGRSRLWIELDTHIARLSALREGGLKLHQLYDGRNRGLPGVPAARSAEAAQLEADLDRFHDFTEAIHPRRTQSAPDLNSLSPQRRLQLLGMGYFGSAASKGGERAEALYDLSSDPRERGAP